MTRRELTCRELVAFLMAYLDGELPDAERAVFDVHLDECPDCVSYLRSYQTTLRLERTALETPDGAVPDEVPEELVTAILAARR